MSEHKIDEALRRELPKVLEIKTPTSTKLYEMTGYIITQEDCVYVEYRRIDKVVMA